ncbi:MAG: thioredoxin-disulfide reductase [Candidatus Bathyarchaeota archaeon]
MKKVIIIGSGPAGLTSSIYIARGGFKPLAVSGRVPGGQLMETTVVENYPGFPEGVTGPDLMDFMRKQAERLGVEFIDGNATSVDFSVTPFKVVVGSTVYTGDAVIIATGASARWLGLESEERLRGRGVSSCSTCDAFFFKDKYVVVVGGGDSAIEEALFLARFAKDVLIVHRRDKLSASKIMQDRAFSNEKIKFRLNSQVSEIIGESKVEGVNLRDIVTGEISMVVCDGVFVAIGHIPNTALFKGQLELNDKQYILTKDGMSTSVEGVFVAGDVYDYIYRQAVTAAGSGCKAALDAIKYLESEERG